MLDFAFLNVIVLASPIIKQKLLKVWRDLLTLEKEILVIFIILKIRIFSASGYKDGFDPI